MDCLLKKGVFWVVYYNFHVDFYNLAVYIYLQSLEFYDF